MNRFTPRWALSSDPAYTNGQRMGCGRNSRDPSPLPVGPRGLLRRSHGFLDWVYAGRLREIAIDKVLFARNEGSFAHCLINNPHRSIRSELHTNAKAIGVTTSDQHRFG